MEAIERHIAREGLDERNPELAQGIRAHVTGIENDVREAIDLGVALMERISLADLIADTATVTVETRLGPIAVSYRPNAMTPAKEAELQRLAGSDDEDADVMLATLFCEVVSDIGISGPMFDADGRQIVEADAPIPLEPEYVVYLPSRLLGDCFTAIQQSIQDEATEKGKASRNGAKPSRNGSRRGSFTRP